MCLLLEQSKPAKRHQLSSMVKHRRRYQFSRRGLTDSPQSQAVDAVADGKDSETGHASDLVDILDQCGLLPQATTAPT
eukprot:11523997-Karenia_brevis.AAC.1